MEIKKLEKYLIKKGNTDMLSSLKKVNKKLIKAKLEVNGVDTIEELASSIIEEFEFLLESSKNDFFTQVFFTKLLDNENTSIFSAYESDVEDFIVFPYDNGNCISYYIPDEIKKIIKRILKI
jgi:hypothetical protein